MTRRCTRPFVLALVLAALAPTLVRAEEPSKELRVPPAPAQEHTEALAKLRKALPEDLHPAFAAVVADARARLAKFTKGALEANSEKVGIRDACKAALVAADFAGISKRKAKAVEALVTMTALQLTADLHAALRERVGRQLAIRAVRKCKSSVACLDAIAPTVDMPAMQISLVREQFAGKAKELEAADRLGNFEVQQLGEVYEQSRSDLGQQLQLALQAANSGF